MYVSLVGWICLISGVIGTLHFGYRERTQTRRTEAEFVRYQKAQRKRGKHSWKTVYLPILRYTADLQNLTIASSNYHEKEVLTPGDKVIIFYNPNRPEKFRTEEENNEGNDFMIRLGGAIICAAVVISLVAEIFVFKELIRF